MPNSQDDVKLQVDLLYRSHFGKMVAWLLYFSKDIQIESAEDIVQDAFASALLTWTKDQIPKNPAGWIFTVCRNKAINQIRDKKKILHVNGQINDKCFDFEISESVLEDQQLQLLFACAHPDLSPKAQVVITLKYIVGLKVEAIAHVFGMTVDGVDKLLSRSRQKIREENILLELPAKAKLRERLAIVHKIIYLIFNEGYKSTAGKELLRDELCEEALLLAKELLDKKLGNNETAALYALMLFNAARFKARFGPNGEIRDLEEQDRSQWNNKLILMACHYLDSSKGEIISSYHYEATIAYFHCRETHFSQTDWHG
ncbi:MAG TPA: sigma-70 family RNA polymerase sigma factor, partial [Puia sp.]|nr:sigma-70 family RNA polymerase sigma factor [Puia sp.]